MILGTVIAAAVLLAAGSSGVLAQQRGARDVARWLQENRQQLQRYTWKSRTEFLIDGESTGARIDRVRYSADGTLERTPLEDEGRKGDHGFLSGIRSRKQRARLEEKERALRDLIEAYEQMSFDAMREAFSRAFVDEAPGGRSGETRVQVRDVVHSGDSMNLWLDQDRLPTRLEVFTALDGEPVRMRAEYGRLDDGPSFLATSEVETETGEKKLVIRTESFDFERERR